MAPLIVESCSGGFNETPVGEVGVLPPTSPGCAALVAQRRIMERTRLYRMSTDDKDDKVDQSLFLQLRVELQRNNCDSATDAPVHKRERGGQPDAPLPSPSTTTTSTSIGSSGYVTASAITSNNNGRFAQVPVSPLVPFQFGRGARGLVGENSNGNASSGPNNDGVKHDAEVRNRFGVTTAVHEALKRRIRSTRRASTEETDSSDCSGRLHPAQSASSMPLKKRVLPTTSGTERVVLAEPDSTTPNTPEQTSQPPQKRCRWNNNKNSLYFPGRESLVSPSTSPSLMDNFLNRSLTSSSSAVLHPSASKLPSATLNKAPPLSAPSLIQPQPLVPGLFEPHVLPSSPCPLFERLYCAPSVLDYSYGSEAMLPRRDRCSSLSPSSAGVQSSTPSNASPELPVDLSPRRSNGETSSSEVRSPPRHRPSTRPPWLSSSSPPHSASSSLASLLSSGDRLNKPSPLMTATPNEISRIVQRLPEFTECFNKNSPLRTLKEVPHIEAGSGLTLGYDDISKIHVPFGGDMSRFPYIETPPELTYLFLRLTASFAWNRHRQRLDQYAYPPKVYGTPSCHPEFLAFEARDDYPLDIKKRPPTILHVACLLSNSAPLVDKLLAEGFSPNYPNLVGQTPLHAVLLGDLFDTGLPAAISSLLAGGANPNQRDLSGDTPLQYVRYFLKEGLFMPAFNVASLLLAAGAEVDSINGEGCTLLCYSVACGDRALGLTRLLLDHGANVWGNTGKDGHQAAAFVHMFMTAMQANSLEPVIQSMHLVFRLMSRNSGRMKAHLQRNMMYHGRSHVLYKDLSTDLMRVMEPYYRQPQSLSALAALVARDALPKKMDKVRALEQLPVPPKLRRLMLFLD